MGFEFPELLGFGFFSISPLVGLEDHVTNIKGWFPGPLVDQLAIGKASYESIHNHFVFNVWERVPLFSEVMDVVP